MKTRNGFVSNSSSASFIILKVKLDPAQKLIVDNYEVLAAKSGMEYPEDVSGWDMNEDDERYEFSTIMDNFALDEFFEKVGIEVEGYDSY